MPSPAPISPCPDCDVFNDQQCPLHAHLAGRDRCMGVSGDERSLYQYIAETPFSESEVRAAFDAFRGVR